MKLLILCSLVFGVACGDDDILPVADAGPMDGGMGDVPGLDIRIFDGGDPCTGIEPARRCDTAGNTCDGDTLTICEANVNGCLVITETDCATVEGATCDDSGAVAMCSSDPCMGVSDCDTEARSCGGDTLTVCAPDAMGCLVSTSTDCAADGTTCDDSGAMAVCLDACDGISDCDTEGRSCDGETLNVCAPDAAGCLVNTATDCAGEAALCDDTVDPIACVPLPCPPADASALVLDCDTGTITGTTVGGSTAFAEYGCTSFAPYNSPEAVYTFEDARSATVTITAVRDEASDFDMDLFALEGGDGAPVCGADSACVASTGGSATETVAFGYLPGGTNYVVYDAFGTPDDRTSAFALTVECTFSTCGDSNIEGPETCDDGDADAGDGCDALCQVEPGYLCTDDGGASTCVLSCGDGVVNGEDECDDAGMAAGDGCSDTCTIEPGYFCEEDAGLSTCALSCGDGIINGEDECDDMNEDDADGCTACVIDAGFECSGAPSVCTASCGDGAGDPGEACDDGNTTAGDGCAADCSIEAGFYCSNPSGSFGPRTSVCGPHITQIDGVLENADTPWTRPGSTCGDGSTDTVFEAVEYTNSSADDQTVDVLANYAFDGYMHIYTDVVDPADTAANCVVGNDDFNGTLNGAIFGVVVPAGETIQIVISALSTGRGAFSVSITEAGFGCGNGLTDLAAEACDDGNNTDGDGCSALCLAEDGFECDDAEPSVCAELVCGNGIIQTDEDCDDMNMTSGDGCSATCELETGFVCDDAAPTVCREIVCGDGIIDASEACDDMDLTNGDGCSDACAIEATFVCGGEPSTCLVPMCGNGTVEGDEVCDGSAGCAADCLSATFSGSLEATDMVYDRRSASCGSFGEDDVYFDAIPFTWNGLADRRLQFTVVWPVVDGFVHAYESPFDPAAPATGCITGDDDFIANGMAGARGSQMSFDATVGQDFEVVLSTYDSEDVGDWELTVTLAP